MSSGQTTIALRSISRSDRRPPWLEHRLGAAPLLSPPRPIPARARPERPLMVPRYARPAMTAIWEAENRFRIWFEIEAHALEAMAGLGIVPREAADRLWQWWAGKPAIDVAAIDAIEAVTRHDVIAFLT